MLVLLLLACLGAARACDLSCFLSKLQTSPFNVSVGGRFLLEHYKVDLKDVVCSGLRLRLSSEYGGGLVGLWALRGSMLCRGGWAVAYGPVLRAHGALGIGAEVNVRFSSLLVAGDKVTVDNCVTQSVVSLDTFNGTGWMVDLEKVRKALNGVVC
jgi:hypothetical protein